MFYNRRLCFLLLCLIPMAGCAVRGAKPGAQMTVADGPAQKPVERPPVSTGPLASSSVADVVPQQPTVRPVVYQQELLFEAAAEPPSTPIENILRDATDQSSYPRTARKLQLGSASQNSAKAAGGAAQPPAGLPAAGAPSSQSPSGAAAHAGASASSATGDLTHAAPSSASPEAQAAPLVSPPDGVPVLADAKPVEGVEARATAPSIDLEKAAVQKQLETVAADSTLTEEERAARTERLNQATKWLDLATGYNAKRAEYRHEIETAPQKIAAAKGQLSDDSHVAIPELSGEITLTRLEQAQREAQQAHETAVAALAEAEKQANAKSRAERQTKRKQMRDTLTSDLAALEKESTGDDEAATRPTVLLERKARRQAIVTQLAMLEAEIARSDSMAEWFSIKRDLAKRDLSRAERALASWTDRVNAFRKQEAQRQQAEAKRIARSAHPVVRELADTNAELTKKRTELTQDMERVSSELAGVNARLKVIQDDFNDVQQKIDVYGTTPTIGLLLRNRRDHLPHVPTHRERIELCKVDLQAVQVDLLELETERKRLGDFDDAIDAATAEARKQRSSIDPTALKADVRTLLEARREYLDSLLGDLNTQHDTLAELELATRKLLEVTETYRQFVDEKVLWIPSAQRLRREDFRRASLAAQELLTPTIWWPLLRALQAALYRCYIWGPPIGLLYWSMLLARRRVRRKLDRLNVVADESLGNDSFTALALALLHTVLAAGTLPLLLWVVGRIILFQTPTPSVERLAIGVELMAGVSFIVGLFYQASAGDGIAVRQFDWSAKFCRAIHGVTLSVRRTILPILGLLVAIWVQRDTLRYWSELFRVVELVGLVLAAWLAHRALRPRCGTVVSVFAEGDREGKKSLGYRMRHLWYCFGVGIPMGIASLSLTGFTYSAEQLLSRIWWTLCLVAVVVFCFEFVSCVLRSLWRRAHQLNEQRRAELASAEAAVQAGDVEMEAAPEAIFDDSPDNFGRVSRTAARLTFVVLLWFVWCDVLPALQVLDRVELWQTTEMVTEEVTNADGETIKQRIAADVPVTLANVIAAALIIVATLAGSRMIPGLIEIVDQGRLPLDHGARYAVVLITRYVAFVCGMVLAFRMVGFGWSSVQWLVAGLTVGLGFGLQEIFANMVSGLIILFERPIRLGDLVTVGDTIGRVTKMQIRATTITDVDNRELIVPNKKFITDNVVNWTLSNPITRFVVPVGISYESDPAEAYEILMDIANKHPLILDDPAPSAVFKGFGDSTLNLELRAFIGNRDDYIPTLHEVNLAIGRAFRKAKIEIAFPQQDIHIRSIAGAVDEALTKPKSAA